MKGFIEITLIKKERKVYINVRNIESISVVDGETRINTVADLFAVKETYSELKALVEEATEGDEVEMITPEIHEFEGTRDALNHLGVERKDDDFEEGCEFCKGVFKPLINTNAGTATLTIIDGKFYAIEIDGMSGYGSEYEEVFFCPMCGRGLKGETK